MLYESTISNDAWTIAVISGGNNDKRLNQIIDSITANRFSDVEILIIGPAPCFTLPPDARHINFSEAYTDCRIPICDKKNLVAQHAIYENLLIIHDRIYLAPEWYENMRSFRKDWQILTFPCTPAETHNIRLADWTIATTSSYEHIGQARLSSYHKSFPFDYSDLRHSNLPYQQCSPLPAVNGACFAVRRSVLRTNPLPNWLHWAEIEDGHWSMQLFNSGVTVSFAPLSPLLAENEGRYQSKETFLPVFVSQLMRNLRLEVRQIGFKITQRIIDTMNREQDIFTRKGVLSKTIIALDAPTISQIKNFDWQKSEGLLLRSIFEKTKNIRNILTTLRATVPAHKRIYLELATCGFRYLKRSEHIRNAESLMYEVACCFQGDFVVEHIFCSRQHNFLFQLKREASNQTPRLQSIIVFGSSLVDTSLTYISDVFTNSSITISDKESLSIDDALRFDAVLFLNRDVDANELEILSNNYQASGFAAIAHEHNRVLDNIALINTEILAHITNGLAISNTDAIKNIVEYNLILQGYSCTYTREALNAKGRDASVGG
jgi:hypothetical protein